MSANDPRIWVLVPPCNVLFVPFPIGFNPWELRYGVGGNDDRGTVLVIEIADTICSILISGARKFDI